MAKGKHSVALFEVIQSDSRFKRSSPSNALKTPSWWFKRSAADALSKPRAVYVEAKQPTVDAPKKEREILRSLRWFINLRRRFTLQGHRFWNMLRRF